MNTRDFGYTAPFRWPAWMCWAVEYALYLADGRLWLALIAVILLKVWL